MITMTDSEIEIENFRNSITDEQMHLYDQLSVMMQEICMSILCTPGMTWVKAYKTSAFCTSENGNSISMQASHVQRNRKVQAFLKSIRSADFDNRIMKREEALQILTRQARGNIGDVIEFKSMYIGMCPDGGGPLWTTKWGLKHADDLDPELLANITEISEGKEGTKVKKYSQRDAIKDMSTMQGWNSAVKHELTGKKDKPIETVVLSKEDYAKIRKDMMDDDDV